MRICAGAALLALCACRAAPQPEVLDARIHAAVDDRLRALFPELSGEISRASITQAVLRAEGLTGADGSPRARAVAALRAGDDEGARELLSELLAEREAQVARAHVAAGDLPGALTAWDRALEVAPGSAALRCERAETALAIGVQSGAREPCQSALADFLAAARRAPSARSWLGASRAARALGLRDDALLHARVGWAVALGSGAEPEGLAEPAERTRAQAVFEVWSAADAPQRSALAPELQESLETLVGRAPEDAWAWERLAELQMSGGRPERARTTAVSALRLFPRDPELHAALARSTRAIGGSEAVVATFEELERRDPADPEAAWQPARERYERGISALRERSGSAETWFREAERGFLRAGEIAADRRAEGRRMAAASRVGIACERFDRGDLRGSRAALLAAEQADPEALEIPIESGRSGLDLLRGIARAWRELGSDAARADAADSLGEAAACYADLLRLAPGDEEAIRATAGLARDAALALEDRSRRLDEKGRRADARELAVRARGLMEAAYSASVEAARLDPDDPDAARAPGRLLVHFLQRDVTQAETWLRTSVRLAEKRRDALRAELDAPGLTATEREERARRLEQVESTLGDAYQDLGALHLELKGDAHGARAWFEKALATGPDPREDVGGAGGWLARCDEAIARGTDPRVAPERRWAALAAGDKAWLETGASESPR